MTYCLEGSCSIQLSYGTILWFSRDDKIRTCDLFVPNEARYRAALHPELLQNAKIQLFFQLTIKNQLFSLTIHFFQMCHFCILKKMYLCSLIKKQDMDIDKFNPIEERIIVIHSVPVLLDSGVAFVYGVETKRINEAVSNNPNKFRVGYVFLS